MSRPAPTPLGNATGCRYLTEGEAWLYLYLLCEYTVSIYDRRANGGDAREWPNDNVSRAAANMAAIIPLDGLCIGIDELHENRYVTAVTHAMLADPSDQHSGTVGITASTAAAMRRRLTTYFKPTPDDGMELFNGGLFYWWDLQTEHEYEVGDPSSPIGFDRDGRYVSPQLAAMERRALACGLLAAMC